MNKLKALIVIITLCSWSNANEIDSLPSFGISAYIWDWSENWLPSIEVPINLSQNIIIQPGISYELRNNNTIDTSGINYKSQNFRFQPSIAAFYRLTNKLTPNIFTGIKLKYMYRPSSDGNSTNQAVQCAFLLGAEYFLRNKISFYTQFGLLWNYNHTTYVVPTFLYNSIKETQSILGVYWPGLGIKIYF